MSRFRRVLLTITTLCHAPFFLAIAEAAHRAGVNGWLRWILALGASLVGILLFLRRTARIAHDTPSSPASTFLIELPYFTHWCACALSLVVSIAYVIGNALVAIVRGGPLGPSSGFFLGTYVTSLVIAGYGVTLRRWWFLTERIDVPIPGLDPRFDGYRIAHLSDLHIGSLTPDWWARRWIERANLEKPDAVAVTGDLVTSGVAFHETIANLIGELRARDGVFCAMGNHDYFGDGEPLISLLEARGARVLRNEGVLLQRQDASMYLAGIDDTWTRRANLDKALEHRPPQTPTIMLAHDPDTFFRIAERGVELVLSGHTHGGQIAVPFLARWINASKLAHHFHLGLYRLGNATLYVHPGLGTTGPPIRLGVAPAVVMLTLRAA
jgi:predicted MPP superfamily phosphohydrolase